MPDTMTPAQRAMVARSQSLGQVLAQTAPPVMAQTAPPVYETVPPAMTVVPSVDPEPSLAQALTGRIAPPAEGRQLTPCDFGFCGDVARIGTAQEQPVYMSDGGTRVLWGAEPGGRSRLGQMLAAERFTPGRLQAYQRGQDAATLDGTRNTPEYTQLYNAFVQQTGDPEAALALADAQVGLDNPGLTGAWASQRAMENAQQLERARSRAAGAALVTGNPSLAGTPYVEGSFQPGLAITGTGETPGTLATAFGGVDSGDRAVDNFGRVFALPSVANTDGAAGIQNVLETMRTAQAQQMRAQQQQERIEAQVVRELSQAALNEARTARAIQQAVDTPAPTGPGGYTFSQ